MSIFYVWSPIQPDGETELTDSDKSRLLIGLDVQFVTYQQLIVGTRVMITQYGASNRTLITQYKASNRTLITHYGVGTRCFCD